MFHLPIHCKYLDRATRRCTVYPRRHELNPMCMPIPQAIEKRLLPTDCPYVTGLTDYRGPVAWGPGFWEADGGALASYYAKRFGWSDAELEALRADCRAGRWR